MNRFPYTAKAILLGLTTTQILATLQVYLSNTALYRTITTIAEAGYLVVPNQRVAHSLLEFGPAFFGGCFFTLSLGAGMSIFSVACAWIWDRILGRNKAVLAPILLLWLATVVAVNTKGFCPVVTACFLVVPFVVFVSTLKGMPKQHDKRAWLNGLVPVLPIAMLTVIWWTACAGPFLFVDIRDYLLLSNPIGKGVDDFYYRYTLNPAEVFKPLEQKTIKSCCLASIEDKTVVRRMETVLINYDYLPVAANGPVDLEIIGSGNKLILKHQGKMVLETTLKEFFSRPKKVLGRFSMEIDKHALFRAITILCLVVGFPVTLYVFIFALLSFVSGFFVSPTRSSVIAAGLCFLIGLALLAPFRIGDSKTVNAMSLSEAMDSESWQQRVAALRSVVSKKLEINDFPVYRKMLASPYIPERYWLAKALGVSRNPETYQDLLALLDDPHPNVVSMTLCALGQRGGRQAIKEIQKIIETSDHWYNQWYAYKALRALGWKQKNRDNGTNLLFPLKK